MSGETYRELGEAGWAWVRRQVRDKDGPWLPEVVDGEPARPAEDRDSLYAGIAGLAPVLVELTRTRALDDGEQALRAAIVDRLARSDRVDPSLYDGLGGDVTALRLLDRGRERPAMARLAELRTPAGWEPAPAMREQSHGPVTDVVSGSAGVVLTAAWAGGDTATEIMTTGGEALLRVAEPTEGGGLDWRMWPGYRSSNPNFSHGTAGVAAALAVAGHALGRADFVAAARRGAEHLVRIAALDDGGFVVEHTIPRSTREVEPVTWNWCHGPAGTSQVFAALARAGVEQVGGHEVGELRRRCLHSVLTSGVPQRLRPGFWDNDGRCCGTAGVGDILLDAAQDTTDEAYAARLLRGAETMADALVERAVRDGDGARWRFVEHRQDPPLLPPGTAWMQGAAGIAAFLLRLARVLEDGPTAPVIDRPDQWWTVPERLCVTRSG
ncbi:lanthionine synthetase LanC family protein [Asanoa sp. WMMD1127]|uniref:lanthionine synthetase LanC family protein n=1 Tax=Asanoa sp. WMMD1127 TaxID=3016107 RepID=UPI0024169538|nr:lanthionine synthetase LanC family protein [Asanoa sp. WMMD1127]MDG4824648.1 lanthionine synthetase LanC family protein [Asanoa sp. WMMD1127]